MKSEIEQAVDKLTEQEPGPDQVDFGGDQLPQLEGTPTEIDIAVRRCTIGDEEEIWLSEWYETLGRVTWKAQYSPPLSTEEVDRLELAVTGGEHELDVDCDAVLEILLPYISHREVYDSDYPRWEAWLWGEFADRDDWGEV